MVPPKLLEQLAMYFVAWPCPPLPVLVSGELTTSHDLLAGLLMLAMTRNNAGLNKERESRQVLLTNEFVTQCVGCSTAQEMFEHCKRFTGEYVHAYDDAGTSTSGFCFVEMDQMEKGDKTHKAICAWNAGQDIMYVQKEKRHDAAHYARMTGDELMLVHRARMQANE